MDYHKYSPFKNAEQGTWYLGYNIPKHMKPSSDDDIYTIEGKYNEQPWRLAKALYGDERLYYIFAILNPDLLVDPVYDFKTGITIRIPSVSRVKKYVGG